MPVHNAGEFLLPAVHSILSQSHTKLELILVDDHSSDRALAKLPEDQRIKLVENKGHGLVDALNTGLGSANFELIARMDADDIAHPSRLKTQIDYLIQNPNVVICGCKVEVIADGGVAQGYKLYQSWLNNLLSHADIEREFFIESPIAHPSAMFYKSKIIKLGGYQDHGWPEDYDLWCRALLKGYKFGKPEGKPLLLWRDYRERTSRRQAAYSKKAFIACKAQVLTSYLKAKFIQKARIWGAGPTGLKLHDEMTKRGFEITGFIDVNSKMKHRKKRDKPIFVIPHDTDEGNPSLPSVVEQDEIVLVAVSARGARNQIRTYLNRLSWREGINYIFAA